MRMIAQDEEDCKKLREMGFTCTQTFENDLLVIGNIRIHRTDIRAYADAHGLAQVMIPSDGETIRL